MNAQVLYEGGRLYEAIEAVGNSLRDDPANARQRTFLFELLCFAGEYERAERQLNVIAANSRDAEMGALLYRSALHAEKVRQGMFLSGDGLTPAPAGPAVSGTFNGRAFTTLSDADPRIGGRLEVFAAGQYTWVPFHHIASIRAEAPRRLRDLLWIPAAVRAGPGFSDFDFGEVLIPALSPLSWKSTDDEVRLGRVTDWEEVGGVGPVPVGLKLLMVDDELVPLLELRELDISPHA
jgi:type VI secretion system protein ImpE